MKLTGEGRPLWAVVTWPFTHNWEEIYADDELKEWEEKSKFADNKSVVGNLNKFFI